MANRVDPDETARYEPSHLDLHCLHKYMLMYAGLNGFTNLCKTVYLLALDKEKY